MTCRECKKKVHPKETTFGYCKECQNLEAQKKALLIEEYSSKVIPMFDGLFTDGEYRKSFYNAVESRIKELEEK